MLYINEAELIGVLSDRDLFDLTDGLSPTDKTALLENVNADAVGIIHGYLRGRYELPITPVDEFLKGIVKDIMKYLLFKRRDVLNVPEVLLKQYATTLGTLKDIQKGTFILGANVPSSSGGSNQGGSKVLYANKKGFKTNIF